MSGTVTALELLRAALHEQLHASKHDQARSIRISFREGETTSSRMIVSNDGKLQRWMPLPKLKLE
jgi:hypothetical protein